MATGRFGRTGQSSTAVNVTSPLSGNPFLTGSLAVSGASSTTPILTSTGTDKLAPFSNRTIKDLVADRFDISPVYAGLILDPSSLNEANKMAAAKAWGNTPEEARKNAQNPIYLRQPGDRLPTEFEMNNPWAYDPKREPIVGDSGKTPNPNDPNNWTDFEFAGYIPPKGSPAYKAMAEFYSSTGETLEQTLARIDSTGIFGQPLEPYPTDLKKVTNPQAIPGSGIYYNPPAYHIVQNPDGTTTAVYDQVGWDGNPAGWSVQPENATSWSNIIGPTETAAYTPTKNPQYWILPNGNSVKSVPGSGPTVGYNPETNQWQTRPWEVGPKTTWDMVAKNPDTGALDLSVITKEVAQSLQKYGNLPQEYSYLVDKAPSYYDNVTYQEPSTPGGTTPKPTPGATTATGMPKVQNVSRTLKTGGTFEGTGAMYAQPGATGVSAPVAAVKSPIAADLRDSFAPEAVAAAPTQQVEIKTGGGYSGTGAAYAPKAVTPTIANTVPDIQYQGAASALQARATSFSSSVPKANSPLRGLA